MLAFPEVPALALPAPAASLASSGDLSMADMESLFTRLLCETENDICRDTAHIVAGHVAELQSLLRLQFLSPQFQ